MTPDRWPAEPDPRSARRVWVRQVSIARWAMVVIAVAGVGMLVGAIAAWLGGEPAAAWTLLATGALVLVALGATASFRVRVDEGGLSVDSVLGLPRFHVALADIQAVRVTHVEPLSQFGGWGLRFGGGGRFGIVLRKGPAIEVDRAGKGPVVVTVDDADTGAALLDALRADATG